MHRIATFAVLALAVLVSPARAAPTAVVTLSSIGDRIRAQNPDLAAARLWIREALGRMNQAGRLANPEIETSTQHNSDLREGKIEVGISQRFPITDRLRLEKNVSLTEVKSSEAEVREIERQLIGKARETVVKILATRQQRELIGTQAAVSKGFVAALLEAAAKGEGSALDAGQAKLEAARLAVEVRQLDASETALTGELKPLLGMRLGEAISVSGALPPPVLPSTATDPARRPDFQVAKLGALAAAQGVTLEQARRFDDVEGGIFTGFERAEDAPTGYQNEAIVGLRFKVALPFWNKNEGAIQEAEAKKIRKQKEVAALGRGIRLEAAAARAEMVEWASLHGEIRDTLLPLAVEQTQLAEEAFRSGQAEIQAVLRTYEKHLQMATSGLDALREFHLARMRHDTALAKP